MPDFDGNTDYLEATDMVEVHRRRAQSGDLEKVKIPLAQAVGAGVSAHATDPAAHLNIVRRTLAGDLTLTAADQPRQNIVPDADRDVLLPAESAAQWAFLLCHAGASYNLTIKRAGGSPVGVLIPGSPLAVTWDGTAIVLC